MTSQHSPVRWSRSVHFSLNFRKIKETLVDFRRIRSDHSPLHINGATAMSPQHSEFLVVQFSEDLFSPKKLSNFLPKLRIGNLPPLNLNTIYRGMILTMLTSWLTVR